MELRLVFTSSECAERFNDSLVLISTLSDLLKRHPQHPDLRAGLVEAALNLAERTRDATIKAVRPETVDPDA